MGKIIRAFIAAELPPEIIQAAADFQKRYLVSGLRLRWVNPANMHLTLKFLGEIDTDRQIDIRSAMQQATQGQKAFRLVLAGTGVFPHRRKPRVLWAGLAGEVDALMELQQRLENSCVALGLARQSRLFNVHLTLARTRGEKEVQDLARAIDRLGQIAPLDFAVKELVLFQSDLRPHGAVYTALTRVPLAAG